MLQDIWKTFRQKNFGKNKKNQLLILLLIGVLLIVIAMPTNEKKEENEKASSQTKEATQAAASQLEKKLEVFLSKVEGAGQVEAMITYKGSAEKIVEKDEGEEETTVFENGTGGEQLPYVKKELMPEVEGIVVITEGGDNAVVVRNITEAVQALFDVDTHKIKIMKGG